MKNIIFLTCVCFLLSSCKTTSIIQEDLPDVKIRASADSLVLCPDVKEFERGDFEEIVDKFIELNREYKICKSKHKQLVDYLKTQ